MGIAAALPRNPDELSRCRGLSPQAVQRHGEACLGAVGRALALADPRLPPPVFQASRDPAMRKKVDDALAEIQVRAGARGVDPALVCSRNELAMLLQAEAAARPAGHRLLRGWRAELIGGALWGGPA